MPDNYYFILGVTPKSSPEDIKKAFKTLAKRYHPDLNPGNAVAEDKFKQIREAYEILIDPEKKSRYDLSLYFKSLKNPAQTFQRHSNISDIYGSAAKITKEMAEKERRKRMQEDFARFKNNNPVKKAFSFKYLGISLLIMASIGMLFVWFDSIMLRYKAEKFLESGDFQNAIFFDPTYGEAYFERAMFRKRYADQNPEIILSDLNSAILYAESITSEMFLERAVIYESLNQYENAKNDYLAALKLEKSQPIAFLRLANIYFFYNRDIDKAALYYDSVLIAGGDGFESNYGIANCAIEKSDDEKALEFLNEAEKLRHDNGSLYWKRAKIWMRKKDTLKACQDINQALNLGVEEAKFSFDSFCKNFK